MTVEDRPTSDDVRPQAGAMSTSQAVEFVQKLLNGGQSAQAEDACRKALAAEPDNPVLMHFLAVAMAMQGRIGEGLVLLRKVVQASPDYVDALQNLGCMLLNAGNFSEAIETFGRLLQVRPKWPQALCNMGKALWETGRKDEAEDACRKALEIAPGMLEALLTLGKFAYLKKEYDKAIAMLKQAVGLCPDSCDAHVLIGSALMAQDRGVEAVAAWRRVVELRPNSAQDYANLGNALLTRARISRNFDQPCSDENYSQTLQEAAGAFRRCLALNPQLIAGHRGLGAVARIGGRNLDALAHYDQALAIESAHVDSHFSRATILLRLGDFARGWEEYEWRWQRPDLAHRKPGYAQPLWDGGELGGRRILLHSEQGFGDAIQFARYAPLVAQRGGQVILECAKPLERLMRSMHGVREIAVRDTTLPAFDVYYPLMSLPRIFKTTLDNIPSQIPYLQAAPADVEVWRERLGERKSFRVGIVWSGSVTHNNDRYRSCSLRLLAPLLGVAGTSFFGLQVGPRSESPAQLEDMGIVDLSPHLTDFGQTAAALAQLDLLISVDTSIVHLAGAMGRPVWPLLAFEGCWRWLENRQDSPWYPSVRLFRQDKPGNWQGLVQEVAQALRAEVENKPPAMPKGHTL